MRHSGEIQRARLLKVQCTLCVSHYTDPVLVLHPENSMFSGYAHSNPYMIQTLNTWKEVVLITIIFLLDCQRWAVCFTISCSPYLLLFPSMVIEGGCRPVKVQSKGGGEEEEGQKHRRGSCWKGQAFIHQRNMCTSPQIQFL